MEGLCIVFPWDTVVIISLLLLLKSIDQSDAIVKILQRHCRLLWQ